MKKVIDYPQFKGLEEIYLEDSWIRRIEEKPDRLTFWMDFVLTERHPFYHPPRPNEHYCYERGKLIFPNISSINWIERNIEKIDARHIQFPLPEDEADYSNIDVLFINENGHYYLNGEIGQVEFKSDPPLSSSLM